MAATSIEMPWASMPLASVEDTAVLMRAESSVGMYSMPVMSQRSARTVKTASALYGVTSLSSSLNEADLL